MNITITNGKGGTGKTTLGTFLAEWLCSHGQSVLIVDLDPNCSMSEIYGKVLCDRTSRHLLTGKEVEPYHLRDDESGGSLDIIPSDLDLDMLANITDTQLKIQLRKQGLSERYGFVLIDPPGTWNAQTRNAVFAAENIIVAGKCSPLDFAATSNYIAKLTDCALDADVTVVCNGYNAQNDPDQIWPRYRIRADLAERLLPFTA